MEGSELCLCGEEQEALCLVSSNILFHTAFLYCSHYSLHAVILNFLLSSHEREFEYNDAIF